MYCSSMIDKLTDVIVKHPKDAFISQEHLHLNWKKFNYVSEPDYEKALKEYEQFLEILSKHVENIYFLPKDDSTGLDSLYAHDPVKFTPEGAIILKSGKELRQNESIVYKRFLEENNIPIVGELTGDAQADGGDIIWLDDRTLAVGRGYRTNDEGIEQIRELTKDFVDEFIVVQLPHDQGEDECLHLMSFISLIDHDLAVVYSPLMPVFFRQLLIKRGIKLIEVDEQEYMNLGCNVLTLSPRVCMLPEGNPKVKEQLEKNGATVYTYKGHEISYKGTGGPTCLTAPVRRVKN